MDGLSDYVIFSFLHFSDSKERKKVKSLSCVQLFATPWTIAHQDPLSMEFSRQEHWSGLPFPSLGDLPDPGIEPTVAVGCSGRCSGIFIIGTTWLPYRQRSRCVWKMVNSFPCCSLVKNPPAMQETWVWSLDWEDPLKKEMATHSSILTWEIPWTEESGRLQSMRSQKSQTWLSD